MKNGNHKPSETGELHRTLGFTTALAIGVGTMIAAGIFTLSGLAIRNVGSSAIISFILAAIVSLFTALSYCEFVSIYPRSGEGYLYARKTFIAPLAYLVGVALFLGYVSSCSFYLSSLSVYFQEFIWHSPFQKLAGVVFLIALTFLNVKGTKESGVFQIVVTSAKIVLLIWFVAGGLRYLSVQDLVDKFNGNVAQILQTSTLIFITFFGFSAIAATAGEVKNPVKNIPKAIFWSMGIVSVLYVLVVVVILAANLTAYDEASLGIVAKKFLGGVGGLVIVGGGIFSMISASNASIMAGSRVALAMSELGHLPGRIGQIHKKFGTPWFAVVVVGGLIMLFTVMLPLEELAHFADTVLLFALIMVNIGLILHRRKFPNLPRPFKVPFYPLTPIIGVLANLYLLFQLLHHPMPLSLAMFALAFCIVGFLYWKGTLPDEEGFEGDPSKLVLETHAPHEMEKNKKIMIPISSKDMMPEVVQLAVNLAKEQNASVMALVVVEFPKSEPLEFRSKDFELEKNLLKLIQSEGEKHGLSVGTSLRVGHNIAKTILESARIANADLIIMGWEGTTSRSEHVMGSIIDAVADKAKRDVIVFRPHPEKKIKKILLPSGGGPHAQAAEIYAGSLAKALNGSLTILRIVTKAMLSEEGQLELKVNLEKSKQRIEEKCGIEVNTKIIKHPRIEVAIIKESANYDTVFIGATRKSMYYGVLFGPIPETLSKERHINIVVVKHHLAVNAVWGKVISEKSY
ncbi:MAG TPA: amino acid permease [Flavobacteriaceae bacterium]|nr:amino acid permease [Flavobacteriaceae bacterium]